MAGPTRKELQLEIENQAQTIRGLNAAIDTRNTREQALRDELDATQRRLQEELEYTQVLAGDRDRLTAALELCTRRLASPNAERLLARSGWRANNLIPARTLSGAGQDMAKSEHVSRSGGAAGGYPRH